MLDAGVIFAVYVTDVYMILFGFHLLINAGLEEQVVNAALTDALTDS
jgi:hypothetical protein